MTEEIARNIGPAGIEIAYQRFGHLDAPAVLLIMGAGAQMIAWPDVFCHELASHGLQVIRFDNRDAGLSTHFSGAPVPDFGAAMAGDFSTVTYSLSDMAQDAIGLMDYLGIDRAHLVGASMGGMIAQTIAIEYPERVYSLTSMMSTTGNPAVGAANFGLLAPLGPQPADREGAIQWQVKALRTVAGDHFEFDEAEAYDRAARSWDRDHDGLSLLRQAVAVIKSGDRTAQLHQVKVPTLVIHGKADKMCDVSGGAATAAAIPNADLWEIEGMGHGLPKAVRAQIANRIAALVQKAETAPVQNA